MLVQTILVCWLFYGALAVRTEMCTAFQAHNLTLKLTPEEQGFLEKEGINNYDGKIIICFNRLVIQIYSSTSPTSFMDSSSSYHR